MPNNEKPEDRVRQHNVLDIYERALPPTYYVERTDSPNNLWDGMALNERLSAGEVDIASLPRLQLLEVKVARDTSRSRSVLKTNGRGERCTITDEVKVANLYAAREDTGIPALLLFAFPVARGSNDIGEIVVYDIDTVMAGIWDGDVEWRHSSLRGDYAPGEREDDPIILIPYDRDDYVVARWTLDGGWKRGAVATPASAATQLPRMPYSGEYAPDRAQPRESRVNPYRDEAVA